MLPAGGSARHRRGSMSVVCELNERDKPPLTRFTVRVRPLAKDDPLRPLATCRATIDEDPGFVHAYGLHAAEAVGHAIIYLSRIANLSEGVRLNIIS